MRDNVYSILSVWGLALAYRKIDADDGRTYELEQVCCCRYSLSFLSLLSLLPFLQLAERERERFTQLRPYGLTERSEAHEGPPVLYDATSA